MEQFSQEKKHVTWYKNRLWVQIIQDVTLGSRFVTKKYSFIAHGIKFGVSYNSRASVW